MIFLKTNDEIELLRASNLLVGRTLAEIAKVIKPGVTTLELDKVAEEFIRDHGAIPTFKGFPNPYGGPFPASICTSVNEQVVHGIPGNVVLKDGDIVSVDCGTYMNGFCGDSAYTFCVGEVSEEVRNLLKVTKEALYIGIEMQFPANAWVTSDMPYRSIASLIPTVWSASLSDTASGRRCTKILRFPIMGVEVRVRCSSADSALPSNR